MWTKLLPEAGGCNPMFLPEAAGGGQKSCRRRGAGMPPPPPAVAACERTLQCMVKRNCSSECPTVNFWPGSNIVKDGAWRSPPPLALGRSNDAPTKMDQARGGGGTGVSGSSSPQTVATQTTPQSSWAQCTAAQSHCPKAPSLVGHNPKELLMAAERTKRGAVRDLLPVDPALLAELVTAAQGLRDPRTLRSKGLQADRAVRLIVLLQLLELLLEAAQHRGHRAIVLLRRPHHVVRAPRAAVVVGNRHRVVGVDLLHLEGHAPGDRRRHLRLALRVEIDQRLPGLLHLLGIPLEQLKLRRTLLVGVGLGPQLREQSFECCIRSTCNGFHWRSHRGRFAGANNLRHLRHTLLLLFV
mmetsp:Transcript_61451/g.101914  ORF Transcript_61451/g.101914 Transcript_61451/m.101914 type:complete len:355 (+) Transcript_61451:1053-2117(+)